MFKQFKVEEFGDSIVKRLQTKNEFEDINIGFSRIPVITVTFQVTEYCNLNCSYCYQIQKSKNRLSLDQAKCFIDLLFQEKKNNNEYLNDKHIIILDFIGGEPLLEVELIDSIIEYFMSKAIQEKSSWALFSMFSISTNGTTYFKDKVQKFIKKYQNKLSLGISLDGNKELHDACRLFYNGEGSYDIVEKACKHYLTNFNIFSSTKLTISTENIDHLTDAIHNLIVNLGYKAIHANCVYEDAWVSGDEVKFYNQLKKIANYLLENDLEESHNISLFVNSSFTPQSTKDNNNYCGGTGHMLAINPSGYIYTCIRFMESSLGDDQPPFRIGHIDTGIGKEKKYKYNLDILDNVTRRSQSTDECFYCPIASGCGWCSGYNYQKFGTVDKRATFICKMHKARALANMYYWNQVKKKYNATNIDKIFVPKDIALEIISEDEYNMLLNL